jgi:hypothetical protein
MLLRFCCAICLRVVNSSPKILLLDFRSLASKRFSEACFSPIVGRLIYRWVRVLYICPSFLMVITELRWLWLSTYEELLYSLDFKHWSVCCCFWYLVSAIRKSMHSEWSCCLLCILPGGLWELPPFFSEEGTPSTQVSAWDSAIASYSMDCLCECLL